MTEELKTLPQEMDVSLEEYLACSGVSRSDLHKIGTTTPLQYYHDRQQPRTSTDAMTFGSAVHIAILEPQRLQAAVVEQPPNLRVRRGKDWDTFCSMHPNKLILKTGQLHDVKQIARRVHKTPGIRQIFNEGMAEKSYLWRDEETGELCKARPDFVSLERGLCVDVKTARDLSERKVANAVVDLGYDLQAYMQMQGVNAVYGDGTVKAPMLFLVQSSPPYDVRAFWMRPWLHRGSHLFRTYMDKYHECKTKDEWPGYGDQIVDLEVPKWAQENYEIDPFPF